MISRVYLRLIVLFFVLLGPRSFAEIAPFYIGTSTSHSDSKGIYLGSLDTKTGKLGPLQLAGQAQNPGFLALSRDNQLLFAIMTGTVGSFRVQSDGMLKPLNEQPTGGDGPCHVGLDANGRYVFVANYAGGNIAAFPVDPEGMIEERISLIPFSGSGPDPARQTKSYAHSVYADPENKFLYSCDLGSDHVWIFKLPTASHGLMPANPPSALVPPGSGPRHLAFGPGGKFVYVINEMGVSVTVYARDAASGALTPLETVPALSPGVPTKGVTSAEIFCHPSGKWLYVSNRTSDTISLFAIAPDGRLNLLQNTPSEVKFPRSFALDPTGHWLIAAGQKDNRIAVFRIDPATGRLTATDQSAEVGSPICVLFVSKK